MNKKISFFDFIDKFDFIYEKAFCSKERINWVTEMYDNKNIERIEIPFHRKYKLLMDS